MGGGPISRKIVLRSIWMAPYVLRCRLWLAAQRNALPSNIISSNSIESFQKNLNKYLLLVIEHYPTSHHVHWRDEGNYLPVCEQKQTQSTLLMVQKIGRVRLVPLQNCGNFIYPLGQSVSFGGDTKNRRSLLSGGHARGSKRSQGLNYA